MSRFLRILAFLIAFAGVSSRVVSASGSTPVWTTTGPYGGLVYAAVTDPSDPDIVYAATNFSVFRSADRGSTWTFSGGGLPQVSPVSIAIDPLTPTTLYLGSSSGLFFKTVDAGATWSPLSLNLSPFGSASAIVVDPVNPATVYVAVGNPFGSSNGVYKSTDGGATWSGAVNPGNVPTILAIDPTTPTTLYAGGTGVAKSIDGGMTWTSMNTGLTASDISALAVDPTAPATVYAGTRNGGVFKSIDGGENWLAISAGLDNTRVVAVVIDALAPSTLYVGTFGAGVYKSIDGGTTWFASNSGFATSQISAMAINRASPATIYAGTESAFAGLLNSSDGGVTWSSSTSGLASLGVTGLAIDPAVALYASGGLKIFKRLTGQTAWADVHATPTVPPVLVIDPITSSTLYGYGGQDNLVKSTDGGLTWSSASSGVSGFPQTLAIDPATPTTLYTGTVGGFFQNGTVFKSIDGGASWSTSGSGLPTPGFFSGSVTIISVAINPAAPNELYAAAYGYGVYKSIDAGASWSAASAGLGDVNVRVIKLDPAMPATIYAGTESGVFKSLDSGATWISASSGLPGGSQITALAVNPVTTNVVYAGTQRAGVFQTVDGGMNWVQINAGLMDLNIYGLDVDRATGIAYAITRNGVFQLEEPLNEAPVAQGQALSTPQDVAVGVVLAATDAENDPLSFAIVSGPAHGILAGAAPNVTYTPASQYFGPDSFTFKANDGHADSNIATVSITVVRSNQLPVAADGTLATNEGTPAAGTLSASDPDGDPLQFAIVANGAKGTAVVTNPATGAYTYSPSPNANGSDSFTFKANDGTGDSNTATVYITISPVNHAPFAVGASIATTEDTQIGGVLNATDADGDAVTFLQVTSGAKGRFVITNPATGAYSYTPYPNATGSDSFSFSATDGSLSSNVATVTVTITSVNDPPVAYAQSLPVLEGAPTPITLTASDPEGDALTFSIVSGPLHGSLSGTAPNVTYTPDANYDGPDSFTFRANDGQSDGNVATIDVSVETALWSNTGLYGGFVELLATDPAIPGVVYAGTTSGLFKSTDFGMTWAASGAGLPHTGLTALAINPLASSMVYAAVPGGLYRTLDGGLTWSALPIAWTTLDSVQTMAIDPITPSTLYVAVTSGISSSSLYKSLDGGITWTGVASSGVGFVAALAIDPLAPATVYAGGSGGIAKTVDGGVHWTLVNSGLTTATVIGIAIDPTAPATIFASVGNGGVFKSLDGAASWAATSAPANRMLVMDPLTPSTLYVGTSSSGVFKTIDGGATWSSSTTGIASPTIYAMAIDHVSPASVYASPGVLEIGLYRSSDGGNSWTAGGISGLANASAAGLAIEPATAVYVSGNGRILQRLNIDGVWNDVHATPPIPATLVIDRTAPSTFYGVSGLQGVVKSTDGAVTWTPSNAGIGSGPFGPAVGPIAIDPVNSSTLYAGTSSGFFFSSGTIFKSTDGGANWSPSGNGLPNPGFPNSPVSVVSIVVSPVATSRIYAGVSAAGVFTSSDAGATWSAVNTGLSDVRVRVVTLDPATPTTLYVGTDSGVFKSFDGGALWAPANSGLAAGPVNLIVVDPGTDTVYAATQTGGVYRSQNGGATWSAISTGLIDPLLYVLDIDPATHIVYASTRTGVFQLRQVPRLAAHVTWTNPADIVFGTALSGTQLNATADTAGTFNYAPGPGTVLNAGSAQTLSVVFTPDDAAHFTGATATVSINVLGANVITFSALADRPYGTAPFAVAATASSGLTVSFASTTPAVCTVSGNTVTVVGGGPCTIQATQPGDTSYTAAAPVSQTFQVTAIAQTITFAALANHAFGSAPFVLSATASSGLAVSFASTTPAVCTVSGNTVTLAGVGTCSIQASQAGNTSYLTATPVTRSFQVTQGSQTITFATLANQPYGTAPFAVSATASSGLAVGFASTTSAVCTVSGSTVTLLAVGTCSIQATQPGNANYLAAPSVTRSFQVTRGSQTIAFDPLANQPFGSAPFTVSATASSGLAVSFASTTATVCTVSVNTVTLVAGGTCTIRATQAGNATYLAATAVNQSFQVTPGAQIITFDPLANQPFGSAPFAVSATASSGLPVTFASTTTTICRVAGSTVTLVAGGTCTIQASQAGNASYQAATPVTQSFQVTPGAQTITFSALANRTFGSAAFTVSATASSGLTVTFASLTSSVCTVSVRTVTLVAAGTCTVQASQAGNASYQAAAPVSQSFQVTPGSQTITFGALANRRLGTAAFTVNATASSGLAVSFASTTAATCTVTGNTVTMVSAGTCSVQATQAGSANYQAAAPVTQSFQVTPATQTITFGALSNQTYGVVPFTVSATASSGLPVSFASTTTTVCTVAGATVTVVGAGTCTVQATQAGDANYLAATPVNRSFTVARASQTITFGTLVNQSLGTGSITVGATASSGLPVSFASTTPTVCTVSGTTVTLVTTGTCSVRATQAGNTNYLAATAVTRSFQVTP